MKDTDIGLGLSIIKKLLEVNKGRIEVESELNHGTTFHFTCPQYRFKSIEIEEPKKKLKKGASNILVINEEEMICQLFFQFLNGKKFNVKTCNSGKEAIRCMKEKHFDLFFCDMVMPEMNGVSTVRELKKIDSEAKIVMMTGYAVEDDLSKAQRGGAYVGLPKPFEMDDIDLLVKKSQELDNKAWLQEARIGLFGNRQMDKAA